MDSRMSTEQKPVLMGDRPTNDEEDPTAVTYQDYTPEQMVGLRVKVRPYYHVPTSPASLSPVRSAYAFEAVVTKTFLNDMVTVRFTWDDIATPWRREEIFYPHELHKLYSCACPACQTRRRPKRAEPHA